MPFCLLLLLLPLHLLPAIRGASECFHFSGDCASCLRGAPHCAWDPNSDPASLWRCSAQDAGNVPSGLFFPVSSVREKVSNREFDVDLRLHDERSVTVEVQLEKKAAVDIYILSDMTFSMKDDLKEVGRTARILLNNIEKDAGRGRVRLGFGGFVDKPVVPFVHKYGAASCNAAAEGDVVCEEPYSYRHVLNFTKDDGRFQDTVKALKHSVSLDKQDGGLEALLQAAVCPQVLGWNPKALKIVAFLSASGIHIQGDALLAGIAENADMRCHMGVTKNGTLEYLRSREVDYPSIGMVSEALEQAGITVIFLAKKNVLPLFRQLSRELPSASAAQLPENSEERRHEVAEIAGILSRSYKKITRLVTFDRLPDEFGTQVETKTFAQCTPDGPWKEASECPEVRLGGLVRFRVVVRLRQCLTEAANVRFRSSGLEDALVRLRVTGRCACEACTKRRTSRECGPGGVMDCGICRCPEGRQGVRCECATWESDEAKCKDPLQPQVLCNGRGRCSCSKCLCAEGFGGPLCRCPVRCPQDAIFNRVCGGSDRGRCECDGRCNCTEGYAGEACDCVKDGNEVNCRERESREILEGKSICSNKLVQRCVLCHHSKTPEGAKNAGDACQKICSLGQLKTIVSLNKTVTGASLCVVESENSCRILVSHELKAQQLTLVIRRECDYVIVHQAALPLFAAVIVCIILVGLLLIGVWKLVVHFEDKAEYNRLVEYQKQWIGETNTNPLYQSPETEVKNPLFQATEDDDQRTMLN